MVGLGAGDLWWVAVSAFVAAMAGWFAIKTRLGASWVLRQVKRGFLEWTSEVIEEHIKPQFKQARADADAAAEKVRAELIVHTSAESNTVKTIVADAVAPLADQLAARQPMFDKLDATMQETTTVLRDHMDADARKAEADLALREEDGRTLVAGQQMLLDKIDANHAESMQAWSALAAEVHEHVEADAIAFAENRSAVEPLVEAVQRIEQKLDDVP